METVYAVVPYVLAGLLVAIVGVLIFGVVAMGTNRFPPAFRNKLMRIRVALHALIVLILLALLATSMWSPGG